MTIPIEDAVRDLYRAMLAHDLGALDALLADDVVYVHSTGLAETKAEFLDGVRAGLYEYERIQPVSERIMHADDLAVAYTVIDFQGGRRGQVHPPVKLITTLVWVRRDNAWRMTVRQATRIP